MQNSMFNTTNILINWHPIFTSSVSNPYSLFLGEQNLKKYHDESTNVSRVSVSLEHFLPLIMIFFQSNSSSSGLPVEFS